MLLLCFVSRDLVQEIVIEYGTGNEERTIRVVHTPGVLYEETGKATNIAQSDFYSEAGLTISNPMYEMISQESTNNERVSYHVTNFSIIIFILLLQ